MAMAERWPSVGRLAAPLADRLAQRADELRIVVTQAPGSHRLIDAGIECPGGIEAGRLIAELCLAGLGTVRVGRSGRFPNWPVELSVHSANPVLACLGSQYAGWSLSHGEGADSYFALGSGPGRALARKEPLFQELGYTDDAESTRGSHRRRRSACERPARSRACLA